MFTQHDLLLKRFGNTRDVLYVAVINPKKVKFGITHRPLAERVSEHYLNFDQFELIAVFTNFEHIGDVEQLFKKWALQQGALTTVVSNTNAPMTEIIDITVVSVQEIIAYLSLLPHNAETQRTLLEVGNTNKKSTDYFDVDAEGCVTLDDYNKTLRQMGIKTLVPIPSDNMCTLAICKKCKLPSGDWCGSTNFVTCVKGAWKFATAILDVQCPAPVVPARRLISDDENDHMDVTDYYDFDADEYTELSGYKEKCKILEVKPIWNHDQLICRPKCRICKQPASEFCQLMASDNEPMWLKGKFKMVCDAPVRCTNRDEIYKWVLQTFTKTETIKDRIAATDIYDACAEHFKKDSGDVKKFVKAAMTLAGFGTVSQQRASTDTSAVNCFMKVKFKKTVNIKSVLF